MVPSFGSGQRLGAPKASSGQIASTGLFATLLAVVANILVFTIARMVFGVSFGITGLGEGAPTSLNEIMVGGLTFVGGVGATLVYLLLSRIVLNPLLIFTVVAVVFLLASLVPPLLISSPLADRLSLASMHVIAGATIIGVFNRNMK